MTGHVRTSVNRRIARVKHVFRRATENEMIPGSVLHSLTALAGLEAGRCGGAESAPLKPVAVEHVEAILPYVSRQVRGMVRLQLLSGMRPGEMTIMRGCDLDMTGKLWIYRLARHKNQVRGKERVVYLGPRAQEIIREFLKRDLSAAFFRRWKRKSNDGPSCTNDETHRSIRAIGRAQTVVAGQNAKPANSIP
jgi:integrase